MDWSYRLLTEEEQTVLRRLSVFAGSFAMEEATTVAADPRYTEGQIVDYVIALIAKSLILVDGNRADARLRLLATTRAYVFKRLAESGELNGIVQRQERISRHRLVPAA